MSKERTIRVAGKLLHIAADGTVSHVDEAPLPKVAPKSMVEKAVQAVEDVVKPKRRGRRPKAESADS